MKLKGKVSIVTGAGQGIGKAIAITFAREGSYVVVNDIDLDKAASVAKEIEGFGGKAIAVKADVSQNEEVRDMVAETIRNFGRIEILVNNAGIQTTAPFLELSEEEWCRVIDVNLKGVFLCSQTVAREMIKQEGGKIINISSVHQSVPRYNRAHYDASKAGVAMLTKDMALELAKYNIKVNCIAPGAIATPMNEDILKSPEKMAIIKSMIPLARMGEPEEVAQLALYLASDEADYITGTIVEIDGGLSLGGSSN